MSRWQRPYRCLASPFLTVLWDKALNCGCLGTVWGSTAWSRLLSCPHAASPQIPQRWPYCSYFHACKSPCLRVAMLLIMSCKDKFTMWSKVKKYSYLKWCETYTLGLSINPSSSMYWVDGLFPPAGKGCGYWCWQAKRNECSAPESQSLKTNLHHSKWMKKACL